MPFGHYQFKVLNFRLTNVPTAFLGVMNRIFGHYFKKLVLVYLDDILVFFRNQQEHLEHLHIAFGILSKNKLYAKMTKCHFAKEKLEHFGHVVDKDGNKIDSKKIETMAKWTRSKN